MDDRIAQALAAAFPDRTVEELASPGASWNEGNSTVRVAFADGGQAYLKVAVDGDGTRIARERAAVEYVAASGRVAVPGLLASDPGAPHPYLATEPLSGRPVSPLWSAFDLEGRATLARELGWTLAGVHAERFEDHGRVVGGGAAGLDLQPISWTDLLVETIEDVRAIASPGPFEHHFEEVVEVVEANRPLLEEAPAALLHGDPARGNTVRRDGDLGLLDWEVAHVGDPAREVVRARDQHLEPLRVSDDEAVLAAFREGYRDRAGGLPRGFERRRRVYRPVAFLLTSGFFDRWAPERDHPTDELAEWVRTEMERRLAAARDG